jgi:hypothetical protein
MPGTNVLSINIFSHPESQLGSRILDALLNNLYNTEEIDLEMGFKVPIFSIPYNESARKLPQFNTESWKAYDQSFIIIVLDDLFLKDNGNVNFLKFLIEFSQANQNVQLLPVTDTISVGQWGQIKLFGAINILRPLALIKDNDVGIEENFDSLFVILFIEIYHVIIKIFINNYTPAASNKVLFFLSHTKYGGLKIAKRIKSFIDSVTQLKRFFDVQDIQIGEDFDIEIRKAIEQDNSIFLTILTDNYSTRSACKMEVLYAKKTQRPILTINAITAFERRSFPYLNNTTVVRWDDSPLSILKLLETALREFLRTVVIAKEISNFAKEMGIESYKPIIYPPELLTIIHLLESIQKGEYQTIIYPSPLIDMQEKELLESVAPSIKFITPWQAH